MPSKSNVKWCTCCVLKYNNLQTDLLAHPLRREKYVDIRSSLPHKDCRSRCDTLSSSLYPYDWNLRGPSDVLDHLSPVNPKPLANYACENSLSFTSLPSHEQTKVLSIVKKIPSSTSAKQKICSTICSIPSTMKNEQSQRLPPWGGNTKSGPPSRLHQPLPPLLILNLPNRPSMHIAQQ